MKWCSLTGLGPRTVYAFMQCYSPSRWLKDKLFKPFLWSTGILWWSITMKNWTIFKIYWWFYSYMQVSGREHIIPLAQASLLSALMQAWEHWQSRVVEGAGRGEREQGTNMGSRPWVHGLWPLLRGSGPRCFLPPPNFLPQGCPKSHVWFTFIIKEVTFKKWV